MWNHILPYVGGLVAVVVNNRVRATQLRKHARLIVGTIAAYRQMDKIAGRSDSPSPTQPNPIVVHDVTAK